MENTYKFLIANDLDVLITALCRQRIRLTLSGDYPEKKRDKAILARLRYTKYYMDKGGELIVLND
ncbi:MAG: hypothetical protein KAS32_01185 [Candidatus Peribacteraceae bacterium]|nr:hypothetical protein [Candidatus Peribacteraceae bacterium]